MGLTIEQIATDYWAHKYFENPNAVEYEDDDFDLETVLKDMENSDWEEVIKK